MAVFQPIEGAENFLRLSAAMGVVDVREFEGRVFVFVGPGLDTEKLDMVRIIASMHWPNREILLSERHVVRTSGVHRRATSQEEPERESDMPPSPPPGDVKVS
jgi:hypothetical protein